VKVDGPDSRYMMQWQGEWRAVIFMLDQTNTPTTLAIRATKALLYLSPTRGAACLVTPGDLVERFDRNPNDRVWETEN